MSPRTDSRSSTRSRLYLSRSPPGEHVEALVASPPSPDVVHFPFPAKMLIFPLRVHFPNQAITSIRHIEVSIRIRGDGYRR